MATAKHIRVLVALILIGCDCGGADPMVRPDGGSNTDRDGGTTPLVDVTPAPLPPYDGQKDDIFEPNPRPDDFIRDGDRNLVRMRVPEAWASTRGAPETIIAVLDTGLDPNHPAFDGALVTGRDLLLDTEDMTDTHGHGTAMAAAVGARSSTTAPVQGVCDACRILPIRVSAGDVVGGFDEMDVRLAAGLRLARDRGASVALVGYTSHRVAPQTAAAIEEVVQDGVVVVAPAGNDGHTTAAWPARMPSVIGVAASHPSIDVAMPESNGPFAVDLWAPAGPEFLPLPGGATARFSATSLASAYAAGVVGLLRSLHPTMPARGVRSLLIATAVPMLPGRSTWSTRGGRLDARSAVRAVFPAPLSDQIMDLAIPYAELLPERPRPGQTVRIRARIANAGTLPVSLDDAVVRLWRDGVAEWFDPGTQTLEPAEELWVEIETTAPSTPGPRPLMVEVAEKPGRIIGGPGIVTVPGNDARRVNVYTIAPPSDLVLTAVVTATASVETTEPAGAVDVEIRDLAILETHETVGADFVEVTGVIANVGNTDVEGGATATLLGATEAEVAPRIWSPGERRSLTVRIDNDDAPLLSELQIEFRTTAADDEPQNDRAEVVMPSGLSTGVRLAYADTPGGNIVLDAPFRIDTSRPHIPFLVFVPEWNRRNDEMVCFTLWGKQSHSPPPRGFYDREAQTEWGRQGHRLFHVHRNGAGQPDRVYTPDGVNWTPTAVDEDGAELTNDFFNGTPAFRERHGAWHRVLRVPWSVVEAKIPGVAPRSVYFLAQATVRQHDRRRRNNYVYQNYSAVLRVRRDALPRFAGRSNDRYYDAHFHTIAEGAEGVFELPEPFDNPAPAQSWAAPLVMVAESAYAHGFTDDPALTAANLQNKIVTTDHNQFYSDPSSGVPTDWTPGSGPTAGRSGTGEFMKMRELFGRGSGEEITVKGGPDVSAFAPPIGRHMLTYDAEHADGPWHGGDPNTLTIPVLLNRLRAETDGTPAAAYPAHPFLVFPDLTAPQWRFSDLEELFGLWPFHFTRAFDAQMIPVARGFQIWNQKWEYRYPGISGADLRRADPWGVLQWDLALSRNWIHQFKHDVRRWNYLIRRGLHYEIGGASPRIVYHRKLFGVGGTDAHGDFNYMTNISATVLVNAAHSLVTRHFGGRDNLYFTNNAWGKVRTYAFTEDSQPASAIESMVHGRSVVTDGPLLLMEVDGDARLDGMTLDYDFSATDLASAPFDVDGFMGGDGPMEGRGTVLMVAPDAGEGGFGTRLVQPIPFVRYRVKSPTGQLFGGPIQEVGMWNLRSSENNLGLANRCQLVTGTFADDTDFVLPLFDPIRPFPFPMNSGATFAHASTTLFTRSTPNGSCIMDPDRVGRPDQTNIGVGNPIWWTLGAYQLLVDADCGGGDAAVLNRLEARVTFPISTSTTGVIFVQALDANGRSTGMRVPATSSRIEAGDDGIAGRVLVAEWSQIGLNLTPNNLQSASSGSFVVVIESVSDALGNVLNPVAMVRHLESCRIGQHCCDLNESAASHRCFANSRHFACGACGDGCTGGELCNQTAPGPYQCELNLGSGCTSPCACCYNGRCLDGADLSQRDDSCGACGNACQPGTRCCDSSCRALDDPTHCGSCGNACAPGESCCTQRFGHACANLNEDPTNCGACGHTCSPEEQCCGGECVRINDPNHCGACSSAACTTNERCCYLSNGRFECIAVDSDQNCGACGARCPSNTSCEEGSCR